MDVLIYKDIDYHGLKKEVDRILKLLKAGDFKSADVKKMPNTGYFRAKLDIKNRLLFKISRFGDRKYIFVLEVVPNHDYGKSRFLNGATVDESQLYPLASEAAVSEADLHPITYVNSKAKNFHILDKILSFDDLQSEVFGLPLPLIVIGSAGSGKTALTLEKIKGLSGDILYTTLSSFLVENARNLYYGSGYDNERQNVDFLSFREYLGGIAIPRGQEMVYRYFEQWISRYQQAYRIKDSYKVFEEFKGVITGSIIDKPYLSKAEYLSLGIRQSVFTVQEREGVYELFLKYLDFLKEGRYHDTNIVSYQHLSRIQPRYDYVVVDEVQDLTNVQLYLILKALHQSSHFLLCGDSNQIVHPNFFSWSNVKTMFYKQDLKGDIIRILATNYRNTPEVTQIANQLLKVKNARFGSIDRESTYLVKPNSSKQGNVEFYEDKAGIKQELNQKTGKSAKFAVLVMRNEDKAEARRFFNTPLLFSIQEAKGLEYENIILYNMISSNEKEFRELCRDVSQQDLLDDLSYARARDKGDKSLEVYKFYVNSLYVAITRAVSNLYVIEQNKKHELLELLELTQFKQRLEMTDQSSSIDDWQKEARKLELQGKQEQADDIRRNILHTKEVPWEVLTPDKINELRQEALLPDLFNKKAKDRLFEYACFYYDPTVMQQLAKLKYKRAEKWEKEQSVVMRRLLNNYHQNKVNNIKPDLQKYGLDHRNEYNLSPLMLATLAGASDIIEFLLDQDADALLSDNLGRNAFQLAMARADTDKGYAKKVFFPMYQRIMPDSIRVKIGDRLVKLHNRQMEFHMLNYMIATQRQMIISKGDLFIPGFEANDFVEAAQHYPSKIMPAYRKARTYISAFLSKNEIMRLRVAPTCRGLFYRIKRGFYIINPLLEIGVGDNWHNYYDEYLRLEQLSSPKTRNINVLIALLPNYKEEIAAFLAAEEEQES